MEIKTKKERKKEKRKKYFCREWRISGRR